MYDIINIEVIDMPSARIHEAIVKRINEQYNMNELLLRIGTVSPDSWRNVPADSGVKDKYLSHFWNFRIKDGQANDYVDFYLKYYNNLDNPFYFGYLLHLIVDQYWKTYVDQRYEKTENGESFVKLKGGSYIKNENWFSYHEGIKMQKRLAKKYDLGLLPIVPDEIENFQCNISELNLKGLFGEDGTLAYINNTLPMDDTNDESVIYDDESIELAIEQTIEFVRKELIRLKTIKEEYDKKIKIAVDIDDTILSTKELEDYYWKKFIEKHPEIDKSIKYKWGDPELILFWKEYREDMAFGKVKQNVPESFNILREEGYVLDLLSARPLDKYSSLKKKLSDYFESKGISYNYMHLGFYSKIEFLKEHNYDVLIDNDLRHIEAANEAGIATILFGPHNDGYQGFQTSDWSEIPNLIKQINKNVK